MKIVFMGTPDFAVGIVKEIAEAGHKVTAVVTQPDRPKGRGRAVAFSPVKQWALEHGIPVFQPAKIKDPEAVRQLSPYEADIFVVAAFGQILSKEILDLPRYGCINVHASLLPAYRGAAPIQWVILNGERQTGVTIMQMNEGLDTGDILLTGKVPISPEETGDSLHDKLSDVGAKLCVRALSLIGRGEIKPVPQDPQTGSYAGMLKKDMGRVDFLKSAPEIDRLVRGLNSWPGAYTYLNGKMLKLWRVRVMEQESGYEPGTVCRVERESFTVAAGQGSVQVLELQPEGKKRMSAGDFLKGNRIAEGDILGRREE